MVANHPFVFVEDSGYKKSYKNVKNITSMTNGRDVQGINRKHYRVSEIY